MSLALAEETCPGILQQSIGEGGTFWGRSLTGHSLSWCGCDTPLCAALGHVLCGSYWGSSIAVLGSGLQH